MFFRISTKEDPAEKAASARPKIGHRTAKAADHAAVGGCRLAADVRAAEDLELEAHDLSFNLIKYRLFDVTHLNFTISLKQAQTKDSMHML